MVALISVMMAVANWIKANQPSVGQFYTVYADSQKPYHVYGGLQDNGVWEAPHTSKESVAWHQTGHNAWTRIMGGDGMQIQVDKRNANIVYTGYQFGNYFRINRETNKRTYIQPKHKLGEGTTAVLIGKPPFCYRHIIMTYCILEVISFTVP